MVVRVKIVPRNRRSPLSCLYVTSSCNDLRVRTARAHTYVTHDDKKVIKNIYDSYRYSFYRRHHYSLTRMRIETVDVYLRGLKRLLHCWHSCGRLSVDPLLCVMSGTRRFRMENLFFPTFVITTASDVCLTTLRARGNTDGPRSGCC